MLSRDVDHKKRDILLFSLPYLTVYVAFMVFPVVYGLYLSFFDWNILSTKVFIGLKNYVEAFRDPEFLSSFSHTLQFVLISTPLIIVVGFIMAMIAVRPTKTGKIAETVFFLPYMLSTSVVGTLWAWIFQKNYGLANQVLTSVGLSPVGWLTDPSVAMTSIIIATLWWTAGFNMILFSAGMKQIPEEIYDAAKIDGAGSFTTLTKITIPLLKETSLLVLVLQVIASFKVFGQVYVMTGGGPYGTTRVLVQYVYKTGFSYFRLGYASAMSIILFVVILLVSVIQLFRKSDNTQ
jgi:multiple sugar transport system permease protein